MDSNLPLSVKVYGGKSILVCDIKTTLQVTVEEEIMKCLLGVIDRVETNTDSNSSSSFRRIVDKI